MAKQKEIKFRDRGYVLEGRRGKLTFALYNDNTMRPWRNRPIMWWSAIRKLKA